MDELSQLVYTIKSRWWSLIDLNYSTAVKFCDNDRLNISQKYIFLVWTEETMLSENGDVINRHVHEWVPDHSTVSIQNGG